MSKKQSITDFRGKEIESVPVKYNFRRDAFRTISPSTSSSDSFDDSFEKMYTPIKKKYALSSNAQLETTTEWNSLSCASVNDLLPHENKTGEGRYEEEFEALDQMFQKIDVNDTIDTIPNDWFEKDESIECNDVLLSTIYEGNEAKSHSHKSVNSTVTSRNSKHLIICEDSLNKSVTHSHISKDSLELPTMNSQGNMRIELNDTLEDVEYVCDEQHRYCLKPVPKASKMSCLLTNADSSIINVDLSLDTSYTTAKSELKVIDSKNKKEEMSHNTSVFSKNSSSCSNLDWIKDISSNELKRTGHKNAQPEISLNNASVLNHQTFTTSTTDSFVSANEAGSEISSKAPMVTCIPYPKTRPFFKIEQDDSSINRLLKDNEYYGALAPGQLSDSLSAFSTEPNFSTARNNTLDDASSLITDSSVASFTTQAVSSKQFNDSLERMEYMMEKGRQIQEKSNGKIILENLSQAVDYITPITKIQQKDSAKNISKTVTPNAKAFSISTKKLTYASPSSQADSKSPATTKLFNHPQTAGVKSIERKYKSQAISLAFKKPIYNTSCTKKESGSSVTVSRLPVSKNKPFNHIVSPIGAYIKNIAAPPLLAIVKPTSEFFDSSYCNTIRKDMENSVLNDTGVSNKPVTSLPVKFFSSSDQRRVIDAKTQKIPGGEKLNRIIGRIPTVISHEGRIHSGSPLKRNIPVDDSFADVSVMSGDISIQVLRDVKRH